MKNKTQQKLSKNTKNNTNTRKTRKCMFPDKSYIVKMLMEMLNIIKLYHWKTNSYSAHIATDELYEKLNIHIDKFVEEENKLQYYVEKNRDKISYCINKIN